MPAPNSAIERLYQTFGEGPLGRELAGCECCSDPKSLEKWADTPIRDLTWEDLYAYLYCAMHTIGDEQDFKHFLPRLIELAADDLESLDFEELGTQLTNAGWSQWSREEREAVRQALDAFAEMLVDQELEEFPVDSIVCGLAVAGIEIVPVLDRWLASSSATAEANLERFRELNREPLRLKRRLSNPFWDGSSSQEVLVADWLRRTMGVY